MKKNLLKTISLSAITAIFLIGCAKQPVYIGSDDGNLEANPTPLTMGIDRQDFEKAATKMVNSLLNSGVLNKQDGGRYIIMMSDIINDTTQRIDIRMLTQKIRTELLQSGKAIFTNAVGTQRDDTTVSGSRELRENEEFDQSTVAQKGTLLGADFGLQGRIIQKTSTTYDKDQVVEYYFQMGLTNVKNGLSYWEDEIIIGKLGSNDSVVW